MGRRSAFMKSGIRLLVTVPLIGCLVYAQVPEAAQTGSRPDRGLAVTQQPQADQLRSSYTLRTGDQILIRAFELDEISERPFRIDGDGYIDLPTLGRVKAADKTVGQLEKELLDLAKKFVRQPQITVTVVQFSGDPIFFEGAFKTPGIYTLVGKRTLVEMMQSIGGLDPNASGRIKVSRRKESGALPLPNAVDSPDGKGMTAEISFASLRDNINPAEDIVLQPYDVVRVDPAEKVYVTGDVNRVGAFDLLDKDSISVLKALVLSGGIQQSGDSKHIWILRPISNTALRAKVPVNLDRIMNGEENDKPLLANDILYVPHNSFSAAALGPTLRLVLPIGLSIVSLAIALAH